MKGCQSRSERSSVNRKLSEDEELGVYLYLKRLDEIGVPARLSMVSDCANSILQKCQAKDDINPAPTVSPAWSKRFLSRYPEFHIRKQKTIDHDRKNVHDPDVISAWFARYKSLCEEKGIQKANTYNFEQTGFRVGVGKDQWIVTLDPQHPYYLGSSTSRELVTCCQVISGDGYVLPPMVILPGVLHQEDWVTKTNLDDDVLRAVSEKGYSNDELALEWLSHFERFSARRQVGTCPLLLLDGHGSHCTREFITFCDEKQIIPFCLPSHTTHLLQPLDVVVFQPLKHFHAEAVDQATRTGCSDFNKVEFLSALTSIRLQAFKQTTILSAFRKTGLLPYNPDRVLSLLHEHSSPPQQRQPTTPPPAPPLCLTTPVTLRSLKRHAEYLQNTDPVSPTFKVNLDRFIKGSLAQAQMGVHASQQLEDTEVAQQARANRQRRSRRQVQKGGVIYAHEARAVVRKKEEDSVQQKLEKAGRELERAKKVAIRERKKIWKPIFHDLKRSRLKLRDRSPIYQTAWLRKCTFSCLLF